MSNNPLSAEVLVTLLRDHTTGRNIFWATHDYEGLGSAYAYHSEILPELITGERGMVVQPRVRKTKANQTDRSKDMAEVFTPSWICNAQNNLVEQAWLASGETDKTTWQDFVCATCLEITCGEAPYLVSRYDAATGEPIPPEQRIGLLDRKLRTIGEHTTTSAEWLEWAQRAYQSTYGYEWQGDSLLLARQSLLLTFVEYFQAKFNEMPPTASVVHIADIVSWNLWQMDGLRGVVPDSCHSESKGVERGLFGEEIEVQTSKPCEGCRTDDIRRHNGQYCLVRDWESGETIRFIDLIK